MIQITISSLRRRDEIATTTHDKAKIMFQAHFSSFSVVSMNDIKRFNYSSFIDDDDLLTERELTKAIHKTTSNKTSNVNDVTNRALRVLVQYATTQMRSLFERCIREEVQSTHFKKTITIVLRKSRKRDYSKLTTFKSIALLDTLEKMLKSIVFERLRYVVETHETLSKTQMKTRRQRSIDIALQLITKKVHTI